MADIFERYFSAFAQEARLAFPSLAGVLDRAAERVAGDEDNTVKKEFGTDMHHEETLEDDEFMDLAKSSRLLAGFEMPADAPAENRVRTVAWIRTLAAAVRVDIPSFRPGSADPAAAGPDMLLGTLPGLADELQKFMPIVEASGIPEMDMEGMSLQDVLRSSEGMRLTQEIGKSLGIEIDVASPEMQQALGMIDQMGLNFP